MPHNLDYEEKLFNLMEIPITSTVHNNIYTPKLAW